VPNCEGTRKRKAVRRLRTRFVACVAESWRAAWT